MALPVINVRVVWHEQPFWPPGSTLVKFTFKKFHCMYFICIKIIDDITIIFIV